MKSALISVLPQYGSHIPADVFDVHYDFSGLQIRVEAAHDGLTIVFDDPIAFRVMDEGDLLEFWSEEQCRADSWVYEVMSGGWLEMESTRPGFLSADRKGLREFLIATNNICVSVLAFTLPRIAC